MSTVAVSGGRPARSTTSPRGDRAWGVQAIGAERIKERTRQVREEVPGTGTDEPPAVQATCPHSKAPGALECSEQCGTLRPGRQGG